MCAGATCLPYPVLCAFSIPTAVLWLNAVAARSKEAPIKPKFETRGQENSDYLEILMSFMMLANQKVRNLLTVTVGSVPHSAFSPDNTCDGTLKTRGHPEILLKTVGVSPRHGSICTKRIGLCRRRVRAKIVAEWAIDCPLY